MQKQKHKWPEMLKRFIDNGFGVTKCNTKEFLQRVNEFNNLREIFFLTNGNSETELLS